jgi:hypothetical protein
MLDDSTGDLERSQGILDYCSYSGLHGKDPQIWAICDTTTGYVLTQCVHIALSSVRQREWVVAMRAGHNVEH